MTRKRKLSSDHPYHVTARCINKDWFRLPLNEVWDIFSDHLYSASVAYGAKIHCFVLMDNHFHLLISTPEETLSVIMQYVMRETSLEITRRTGRINQTYGAPYYSCLIESFHHFTHAYKYVYRNPVEAGLSARAEDYIFSTLNSSLGFSTAGIPLVEDTLLFPATEQTLQWINEKYIGDAKEQIKAALRRRKFKLPIDRERRIPHRLELEMS